MKKILIVEDDLGIAESLKLYLENSGFKIFLHNNGKGVAEKIQEHKPDLIILDINLPHSNGIEICSLLREKKYLQPIIFLTANDSEHHIINGFESGGDDYITKPFSPRELKARIESIFRRQEAKDSYKKNLYDRKVFGEFEFLEEDLKLIFKEKTIEFTQNEFDIFFLIVKKNGKLTTREDLMKKVIGYDKYIYDRTLDTHIKNIRKKLENKDIVETVRGKGFKLFDDFTY